VNTVHRMIGDALQDMSQIEVRIEIVEFGRAEQALNGCCAFAKLDMNRAIDKTFSLARVQTKASVLHDSRDASFSQEQELLDVATTWLSKVAPLPTIS
jgi:hypothetical protein